MKMDQRGGSMLSSDQAQGQFEINWGNPSRENPARLLNLVKI